METFSRWSIAAVNLPEHADNPVHTVEGGLAAGYDGAVVAGTTVFAYLTRPVAAAWGRAWVVGGGYEVWFQGPVLADERVVVAGGSDKVVASVGERVCVRLVPERRAETPSEASGKRPDPTRPAARQLLPRWTPGLVFGWSRPPPKPLVGDGGPGPSSDKPRLSVPFETLASPSDPAVAAAAASRAIPPAPSAEQPKAAQQPAPPPLPRPALAPGGELSLLLQEAQRRRPL